MRGPAYQCSVPPCASQPRGARRWCGVAAPPDISNVAPWPAQPLSGLLRPCERPILITGAGVSAGCGLPTASGLAHWLRAQDFAQDVDLAPIDAHGDGGHPGYVATAILNRDPSRRGRLLQAVAAHIAAAQAAATHSRVLQAIAATPVGVVLTLNYDTLIEDAARAKGLTAHSLAIRDIPELINDHLYQPDGALRVVHLHGITDDPGSLVLDHDSYMRQANENEVKELVAVLTAHHNLCAVGTQLEEDYLGAVMLARRPTRPRHVIVCDVDLAERVRSDTAGIRAGRHNWLACGYPVGAHDVLEAFCEQLVTCEDGGLSAGLVIPTATADTDTTYARRRLVARDEVKEDSELSVELQLQFGDLAAYEEKVLEQEQLSIVIGPPGSGKTRLLQEAARRGPAREQPVLLRLRDVRDVVGEPEPLFAAWLSSAVTLSGDPVNVEDVLDGRIRAWVLLDGLDEAPLEHRRPLALTIERLARAYPQQRFTVTSRPVAALGDLSSVWRIFDLLCDDQWQQDFLQANGIDAGEFWTALADAGAQLQALLQVPFFLRGAARLIRAGEPVDDAMQIALALLDQAIEADEQLAVVRAAAKVWLARVALVLQLSGTVTVGHDALRALAAQHDLGDPAALADLLAGRSLLAASADRWAFTHRLFAESLVAEWLLAQPPLDWLDAAAPQAGRWSAVLDHWKAPLQMLASRSDGWREAIATRDPRFAARATPVSASVDERFAAARLLWRRAIEWDIWIDPLRRDADTVSDGVVVAQRLRAGGLEQLEDEIRAALGDASRFARGNAIDMLSAIPVDDTAAILADVLRNDDDSVVRRSAASAARRLELSELADLVVERARRPEDEAEATDMASVALYLVRAEDKLAVATSIVEAGNTYVRDYLVLEDAPLADRLAWLAVRATADRAANYSVARELARTTPSADGGDAEIAGEIGYVAALVASRDAGVLDFVRSRPEAAEGIVRALREQHLSGWEIARLLMACGTDALRAAGADDQTLAAVAAWEQAAARPAPEVEPGTEPEPTPPADLAAVLRLPVEQRRAELIRSAVRDRANGVDLSPDDRVGLRETLDQWWGENDLREAVQVSGSQAQLASWALVVLRFAPAVSLTVADHRWIQVATCGWLLSPQIAWLRGQASRARLDQAVDAAPPDLRVLTDLLQIGAGLDLVSVGERMLDADEDRTDDATLRQAGQALAAAQAADTLTMLSDKSDRWKTTLQRYRAAAGVLEAQLDELEALAERLQAGEPQDRFALEWMDAIHDPRALPALETVLVAAGSAPAPEAYPDITVPVLGAISGIGDAAAVDLLDRVARERSYRGAQFLVDDRDRLIQLRLELPAQGAARQRAEALDLPPSE